MKSKAQYTVITKILGIFMVFIAIIGFIVIADSNLGARTVWETLYMLSILMGGVFNILDFGKVPLSALAFIFYIISAILSASIGLVFLGQISSDFLLIFAALLISALRLNSVWKKASSDNASALTKSVQTQPTEMDSCGKAYTVDSAQNKCRVGIMRQAKASLSGRVFHIYVDGTKTITIRNGDTTRLILDPGQHVIVFGIGSKITSSITLNLAPGSETNIMCGAKGSRVEAALTSVDVCSLASQNTSTQPQSDVGGCLVGLILFLIGMSILGVGVRFFIYLVPIG